MREGWERVALGSVIKKRKDFTPVRTDRSYRCAGVQRSGWGLLEREPFDGSKTTFTKLMRLERDDLVYRTITAFEAPSAVVDSAHAGLFVSPQTFPVFKIESARLLPAYMRLLTTSTSFHESMASRCTGSVLRRMTLSVGAFESIPIDIPPLIEQRRIVDLICAADEAIEAADTFGNVQVAVLGMVLDAHWAGRKRSMGEVASFRSGPSWSATDSSSLAAEGSRPVLTIVNTRPDGTIDLKERTYVSGLSDAVATITESSLVMIRTNGNRGRIGNVYRPEAEIIGDSVSAFQFIVKPIDPTDRDYLYWLLRAPSRQREISEAASGSTGLGNIAAGWLRRLQIPWAKESERHDLVRIAGSISEVVAAARQQAEVNRFLRTELLSALLSGRHEIPASCDRLLGASTGSTSGEAAA